MIMVRQAVMVVVALGALAGPIAACGGDEQRPATDTATEAAAPAPAEEPASGATTAEQPAPMTDLDVTAFAQRVARPGTVVLDVRTPEEYAQGHLKQAKLVDVSAPDFAAKIAELPKGKRYAVYCRTGNRSAAALQQMAQAGFTDAAHLVGGITAWQGAGKPVVQ